VTTPPNKEQREEAADRAVARSASAFVIRRPLDRETVMTAAGAGLAVGLVTAYLASIWLARAPLDPDRPPMPRATSRTSADRPVRRRPAE
jgi:cation transporter-like permease